MVLALCVSTTSAVVSRTHLVLNNCSTGKKPSLDDGMVKCPALCYMYEKMLYTLSSCFIGRRGTTAKVAGNRNGAFATHLGAGGGLALVLGASDILGRNTS